MGMVGLFDDEDFSNLMTSKQPKLDKTVAKRKEKAKLNPETLFKCNRTIQIGTGEYADFTKDYYTHSINFYDFEVFKYDWCVVIINPIENECHIIWNDRDALIEYYEKHKKEVWCGYNSRTYDTFILKSILIGLNPKKVNDAIIIEGKKGFDISDKFRNYPLYNFDIMVLNRALKQLEGFMGNDIRETTVPFDLERQLTPQEAEETIFYCRHDVEQTIEVFRRRKEQYDSQIALIDTFDLKFDRISLTQAQLTAEILECEKTDHNDEFDIKIVPTIHLKKYRKVMDWFLDEKNHNYKSEFSMDVCGVPHDFGWGGIHGCPDEPLFRKGRIFHCDVTSYYPSLMIVYDKLTRNCKNKKKYPIIYDTRVALKKAGKKKEQAPYKVVLNGTYGICKDKHSKAYDPLRANEVCINGQLMLLDLLEHLEGHCEIIQSNTDGIILMTEDSDEAVAEMKEICNRWIKRTKMGLGFDEIEWIFQKDVNNYCFKFKNGGYERKGAYVKETNDLDNDLPIVNEALVRYMVDSVLPEVTINDCDDFKSFQKIVRISGNYLYGVHNNERLTDRTFRVFASKDFRDSSIYKVKEEGGRLEKFGNTPEHCFIYNEDVNDKKTPDNLDKQWYIALAEKRLRDFGITVDSNSLF